MAVTPDVLESINNGVLANYIKKGTVFKQNVQNKPMLRAFDAARGKFAGGKNVVSLGVKSGQGGGSLTGYSYDDQVSYYNPATNKRVEYAWKEHHIGITIMHTELKVDGITIVEPGADQSVVRMEGREKNALVNLFDEKMDDLGEDYAVSLDSLIHGDGTSDTKALAGIGALVLPVPSAGVTGGLSRVANSWWQNRAATAANGLAGGQGAITSAVADGGALLAFMQKEYRQYLRYARGGVQHKCFAGSDFISAMEKELRANGLYSQTGWRDGPTNDGGQATDAGVPFKNWLFVYDPTLDELGLSKRAYILDMKSIQLLYMNGERMHKHQPARPYDRYAMYNGITTTAVMAAQQLNTSGIIDIA